MLFIINGYTLQNICIFVTLISVNNVPMLFQGQDDFMV